jgi:hypothetical protein
MTLAGWCPLVDLNLSISACGLPWAVCSGGGWALYNRETYDAWFGLVSF